MPDCKKDWQNCGNLFSDLFILHKDQFFLNHAYLSSSLRWAMFLRSTLFILYSDLPLLYFPAGINSDATSQIIMNGELAPLSLPLSMKAIGGENQGDMSR